MNLDYKQLFFKATGLEPFPYQCKVATGENFPELIKIPTGAGKTAGVILPWVWRRQFAEKSICIQTPRRLIYCLPMRVLVEQTYENAISWLDRLGLLAGKASWKYPEEKTGLIEYLPDDGQTYNEKLISVHLLMGGEDAGTWDENPERDSILIGTQDMLLSRALNRGYASSRFRWPIEFGLLNNDCLWVMDEVQLMGAGLSTSAQMEAFRNIFGTFGNHHTIWMSATCETAWIKTVDYKIGTLNELKLSEEDEQVDTLYKRLTASKKLEKVNITLRSAKKEDLDEYIEKLSNFIFDKYQQIKPDSSILVIVNTVNRAQGIFQALQRRCSSELNDNVPKLFLLHGQLRLHEKAKIFNDFKSADNKNKGKILISTQVIEAGVDISVSTLITELAPWSSIVQRFGRLNRYGENDSSTAIWIDIKPDKKDSNSIILPYSDEELDAARSRLEQLHEVSLKTLANIIQPQVETQKHVIRRKDLVDLFDTTADLTGNDIDISRFIRDSEDRNAYVYWRDWNRDKPPEDFRAPSKDELCQVPIEKFRLFCQKKKEQIWLWDYLEGRWTHPNINNIYPGQTFLIDSNAGGYDPTVGWLSDCKDYVNPVTCDKESSSKSNDYTGNDQGVASRKWETIATHGDNTLKQMNTLLDSLKPLTMEYEEILKNAAFYHDIGKAHEIFQEALLSIIGEDEKGELSHYLWAKMGHSGRIRYKRKHFRHELASALILLQNQETLGGFDTDNVNLIAYLIASHHGKVRLSIRSVPGETVPDNYDMTRFARGIWDGDIIPEINLDENVPIPSTVLDLSLMEVGMDEHGNPSWLERMCKLRDNRDLGPFRLAYLEGLVRIADWRASSLQEESNE